MHARELRAGGICEALLRRETATMSMRQPYTYVCTSAGELTSEEDALLRKLLAKQSSTDPTTSPHPGPSSAAFAGEVEMYEAGGTLVIKTAGDQGDVVINGKRVAAALDGLQQAHAAMSARVAAVESGNMKPTRGQASLRTCARPNNICTPLY